MLYIISLLVLLTSCTTTVTTTPEETDTPIATVTVEDVTTPEETWTPSNTWNKPWNDTSNSIVIDAYEGNSIDWDKMSTDKRVKAVIHRSSIGLRLDTKYQERRLEAKSRGYLWGAYHFGKSGNVTAQADLLISLVSDGELAVLDLEDFSKSGYMNASEAIEFIKYYYSKTGEIPVIYANHNVTKQLTAKYPDHELLKRSKLWYARFKSSVSDFPSGLWSGYYLWQFSSEINCSRTGSCLYNVEGTRYDMDVNVFEGDLTHWP